MGLERTTTNGGLLITPPSRLTRYSSELSGDEGWVSYVRWNTPGDRDVNVRSAHSPLAPNNPSSAVATSSPLFDQRPSP